MIKIGITGGIGSGKSIVCEAFKILGYFVYNADKRAKILNDTNEIIIIGLKERFGKNIYNKENKLDRQALASYIFKNPDNLEYVNNLVHPVVIKDYKNWLLIHNKEKITFKEAAILFESETYKSLDYIISVIASEKTRIQRVCKRDNIPEKMVIDRMKNQISDEKRIKLSDFVINNNDDKLILPQIIEINNKLNTLVV